MNPFNQSLEDTFRTQKVRVISRDEVIYTGFVDRIDWNQRHVVLHGADRDGEHVGAAMISHAERIELTDTAMQIKEIPLQKLYKSPYAVRTFDEYENMEYIETVRQVGRVRSFPVVRAVDDGYEIVDGHKALWVCNRAGVTTQPCRIIQCSEREAAQRFVWDHLPLPQHFEDGDLMDDTWYGDDEIRDSISRLGDRFGAAVLDWYPVDYNVHRLQLTEEIRNTSIDEGGSP